MNIRYTLRVRLMSTNEIRATLAVDRRDIQQAPAKGDEVIVLDCLSPLIEPPVWDPLPRYGTSPDVTVRLDLLSVDPDRDIDQLKADGWKELPDAH